MEWFKILGSCFSLSVGVLIFITGIAMCVTYGKVAFLIGALIFGSLALLSGILGLTSKVIVGGVLALIILAVYIYMILLIGLTTENPFETIPMSFFFYQWNFVILIPPLDIPIPVEAILIALGGGFLLASRHK